MGEYREIRYSIWDPTGNITALVETPTEIERQPQVAAALMIRHPEIEQVGFVEACEKGDAALQPGEAGDDGRIDAALRMAGGEFCGNASLCAAAWYLSREREPSTGEAACSEAGYGTGAASIDDAPGAGQAKKVFLKVSGARETVEVTLSPQDRGKYEGFVIMPPAIGICERGFAYGGLRGDLPVVEMEGISHIVIEPESEFSALADDRAAAEDAVRLWCGELEADGLGLMFVNENRRLTPLVYIPGSGTVFWENSCASGTTAVGMAFAKQVGITVDLTFEEPGGRLRVLSDPDGRARLCGRAACRGTYTM